MIVFQPFGFYQTDNHKQNHRERETPLIALLTAHATVVGVSKQNAFTTDGKQRDIFAEKRRRLGKFDNHHHDDVMTATLWQIGNSSHLFYG